MKEQELKAAHKCSIYNQPQILSSKLCGCFYCERIFDATEVYRFLEEYKGDKATILVPALAFDKNGFRMGYGKGYYDRFLSSFTGVKVGLCYSRCVSRCIFRNWYDEQVDYIITDKFTKFIAK